ncbi:MAG: hypothetical protein AAF401_14295 [Pseudomonadota bacterium]
MRFDVTLIAGAALAALLGAGHASAGEIILEGSLVEGGFDRYVPPVTNPIFNETPLITTELRPIYFHQRIPGDFATGGGNIDVVAAQVRVAITDRLGFLATTDGYAFADFDTGLPDSEGFADLAIGLKYALLYEPAMGEIVTVGARYTVPTGDLDVGGTNLTGVGDGFLHGFVSAMKIWEGGLQLQGNVGAQQALSGHNASFAYGSIHASYEIAPGVYPLVEANVFLPYDGGNRVPGSEITGFDVADLGASDQEETVTLAAGARWRPLENAIFGAAFEYNVAETSNHLFQWRAMFDAVLHF